MTEKERDILLKDLCARLPYGVMCNISKYKETYYNSNLGHDIHRQVLHPVRVTGYHNGLITFDSLEIDSISVIHDLDKFKPYLRPMSSMTEEEYNEYENFVLNEKDEIAKFCNSLKFYGMYHFDYNDLIGAGLALKAPEGMYNDLKR